MTERGEQESDDTGFGRWTGEQQHYEQHEPHNQYEQHSQYGQHGQHDDDWDDDEPSAPWQEPPDPPARHWRPKLLIPVGAAVTGLGVLFYAAVTILGAGPNSLGNTNSGPAPAPAGFHPSATDPAIAAQQTAQAFLDAWAGGDVDKASKLTDSPVAAAAALRAYSSGLHLSKLMAARENNVGGSQTLSFDVSATVGLPATASAPAVTGTWTYASRLTAQQVYDAWLVRWQPDLLAPRVSADTHPATEAVPPGAGTVTDAASNNLAGYADPGLKTIAQRLMASAPSGRGTPGLEVAIVDASGTPVPQIPPAVLTDAVASGTLATTIDPKVENAAVNAVITYARSSMVVLQPSTGKILAIANNDGYNDDALTARIAPGSTMKVVTSAALLNQGITTQSGVACPAEVTVTGAAFHNSGGETRPAGTPFIDDFAASCNNAFTSNYDKLSGGVLASTAQTYFGLNQTWDLGLGDPQAYFTMPPDARNSELAAESFGQGTLAASPLAMASVAATVDSGSFHQPYLVDGATKSTATPLPGSTAAALRSMMHAVVAYSDGTAHQVGFGSGVYAKTGTADHGAPGATPNSWLIAYDPGKDLAVGCVVLGGDFGAQSAGPEVKALLAAL
jgi:hypothetical protein